MFKKLVLIAVVLIALLATTTSAFAQTNFCDPPPTPGQTRNYEILCWYDTSYKGTTQMGTKDQPFTEESKAIAEAQANSYYGGTVVDKQTGASKYYQPVVSRAGAPISRTTLFILLGMVSLILMTIGWFLRRRAGILSNGA